MTAPQEIGWIGDDAALARLVAALEQTSIAAVDTEFVREKTYYPQLCLIQIGTGEQVACIDCLADLDLPGDELGLVHALAEVGEDEVVGVGGGFGVGHGGGPADKWQMSRSQMANGAGG